MMMTDSNYRALLSSIADRKIKGGSEFRKEVEARLGKLTLPDWLPPAPAFSLHFPGDWESFQEYQSTVRQIAPETARKLREASAELNEMLFSSFFSPPEDIVMPMLAGERVDLADFLREVAKWVDEGHKDFAYHSIENPTGRKISFKSFWIRNIKNLVCTYHEKHFAGNGSPKPEAVTNNWLGLIQVPTKQSTNKSENHGVNIVIANICSTLLAEDITPDDVAHQ